MDEAELEALRPTPEQEARARRRLERLLVILVIFPIGAILFASASGIYLIANDQHVTSETCTIESAPKEFHSRTVYWEVPTSCGRFTINPGNSVSFQRAHQLLGELHVGLRYSLTLVGFGWWDEREITAAFARS